jgi:Spy/CpxP family protein refolding chaperone
MKQLTLISFTLILFLSFTIWNIAQQKDKSWDGQQRHERFAEKLNLTEEQQSAIEQIRINNQKEMIDLKSDLERKKLDVKELKTSGNYSRDEFINLVEAVNNSKKNITLSKANNMMDIYELLNTEQKKTFDKIGNKFGKHRNMMKFRRMMDE